MTGEALARNLARLCEGEETPDWALTVADILKDLAGLELVEPMLRSSEPSTFSRPLTFTRNDPGSEGLSNDRQDSRKATRNPQVGTAVQLVA